MRTPWGKDSENRHCGCWLTREERTMNASLFLWCQQKSRLVDDVENRRFSKHLWAHRSEAEVGTQCVIINSRCVGLHRTIPSDVEFDAGKLLLPQPVFVGILPGCRPAAPNLSALGGDPGFRGRRWSASTCVLRAWDAGLERCDCALVKGS